MIKVHGPQFGWPAGWPLALERRCSRMDGFGRLLGASISLSHGSVIVPLTGRHSGLKFTRTAKFNSTARQNFSRPKDRQHHSRRAASRGTGPLIATDPVALPYRYHLRAAATKGSDSAYVRVHSWFFSSADQSSAPCSDLGSYRWSTSKRCRLSGPRYRPS